MALVATPPRVLRMVLAAVLAVALSAASSSAVAANWHRHRRPCANASLRPTATNLNLIRTATLCLVDRARAAHGERSLRLNWRLDRAAQTHTAQAWPRRTTSSTSDPAVRRPPRGCAPPATSARRVGYEVGENIAWGTLWDATPRVIVSAWMRSPGHRANILDGHYRDTGIGISPHPPASLAHGQAGAVYTQDFGVIDRGRAARVPRARRRLRNAVDAAHDGLDAGSPQPAAPTGQIIPRS